MTSSMPVGGGCDCGAVRFELEESPVAVNECSCSFCRKLGMLWSYCTPSAFRVVQGGEQLASYLRGDRVIAFRFCPGCACMIHWEALPGRSVFAPGTAPKVGVNARLIEGVNASSLPRLG